MFGAIKLYDNSRFINEETDLAKLSKCHRSQKAVSQVPLASKPTLLKGKEGVEKGQARRKDDRKEGGQKGRWKEIYSE